MRQEKAYDYFSAYFEGSLDASLKAQFERVLESNPAMQEEYAAFASSMMSLNDLAHVDVAVPDDLHDRITARLDRHLFEAERKQPASIFGYWRQLAMAGVAAVAIVGGIMALGQRQGANQFGASSLPVAISDAGLTVEANESGASLRYQPTIDDVVEVRRLDTGALQKTYSVKSRVQLEVPLDFKGTDPLALRISRKSDANAVTVILPGSVRSNSVEGSGTVLDFAKTLASVSGRPIVVDSKRESEPIRWKINPNDVTSPQENPQLKVEIRGELIRVRF